jgi:non-heme chloroperoxidase
MEHLDLKKVIMVGHSTGGGEIARYVGRHGTNRVAKMVLIGAVPPIMVSTTDHPDGLPVSVFDGIRTAVLNNRSQFYLDLPTQFYGFNREGHSDNQGLRHSFWMQGMMGSIHGQYLCIHEFSEVDYTSDLESINVPTLVIHGDDDQIVPIDHAGRLTAKIVKGASLKVYLGAPHGLTATHQDQGNADLISFARS